LLPALILIALASILLLYAIAVRRGADRKFWILMGLLFGPLAIPFVFFSKRKAKPE
jgi:hypothetical protein